VSKERSLRNYKQDGGTDPPVVTKAGEGAFNINVLGVGTGNSSTTLAKTTFDLPENGKSSSEVEMVSSSESEEGEYGVEAAIGFLSVGISANIKNITDGFENLGEIIQDYLGEVKEAITNPPKGPEDIQ
jgi:hypothetical protein